jgi:P-type conjugative transfer protein TrbJ
MPRTGLAILGVGDVVIDPTNLVQNTLTALRTLQTTLNQATQIANELTMITHQVKQLANEATMLTNQGTQIANQVKELTSLPTSILGDLMGSLQQYTDTLKNADGLTYQLSDLTTQFNRLYPTFGRPAVSSSTLVAQTAQWTQQVRSALQGAMQVQSVIEKLTAQRTQVGTALTASQAAVGNLQVSQASNQLLGVLAEQLASLQQIIAASGRAETSLMATEAASDDAARANAEHFMRGFTDWHPVGGQGLPAWR